MEEIPVGGALDYDALVIIYYMLPGHCRDRAVWLGSEEVFKEARKLTDEAGRPLWRPSLDAEAPDRLLGKFMMIRPDCPADELWFGDPRDCYVRATGITREAAE